jgi:hypothetical protein
MITYKLKSLNEFVNEAYGIDLWRNTNFKWLLELLKRGKYSSEKGRFISLSNKEDSGGQDDFGGTRIQFNAEELYKQGAIEIEYDRYFFDKHSDICRYVTGYDSEDDYYQDHDYKDADDFNKNGNDDLDTLSWESMLEDYENEDEIVIKEIKFNDNLIKNVTFTKDKPNKALLELLDKYKIHYD